MKCQGADLPHQASPNLMHLQLEALYRCDESGRLRCGNEPGEPAAPRFFMGRTAVGNLWRVRYDLPDLLVQRIATLCDQELVSADLTRPPAIRGMLLAVLREHGPVDDEWRGPAYSFPTQLPHLGEGTLIADTDVGLVKQGFGDLYARLPELRPCVAVVEDGVAVSVCFSSRNTPRAAEAGVETLEPFRGKGYGAAAVAGWAAEVRKQGRVPLYSTSWQNHASQGLARKLGLLLYGEDWSIA